MPEDDNEYGYEDDEFEVSSLNLLSVSISANCVRSRKKNACLVSVAVKCSCIIIPYILSKSLSGSRNSVCNFHMLL